MPEGHELEMEFVPLNLREIKVRSPRQSSLMVEGSKQTGSNLPQIICKQEPVEDSVENGYETPTKSSRAGAGSWTSNGVDIKPGKKAWSPVYLEGLEGRFREHCEVGLCLDDQTLKQALRLFKESKSLLIANVDSIGTGTVEETERLWGACVLYVVKTFSCGTTVDAEKSKGNAAGFTLSQLMRQTKISVVEFFKELPHFLVKVGPIVQHMYGDEWEKRLQVKEVQANFVHLAALYTYYKRVYQDFFLSPDTFTNIVSRSLSGARDGNHVSIHMQFGWMLFLTLRVHILQQFSDLVTCTNALLVVMVVLILHMPPDLRKFSLQDPVRFAKRTPEGVDLVASLCTTYYASDEDVLRLLEKANITVSNLLGKTLMDSQKHQSDENFLGIKPDGLAYMEGLMDNKSIASNLRVLEKDYEDAYQSRGGLDERMFINGDDSLLGTSSSVSPRFGGSKRKYDIMSSPVRFGAFSMGASPSSPAASPWSSPVKHTGSQGLYGAKRPPSTPVSITMTTAKWLRTVISPLPAEPSVELQLFFRSCDRDISADVKNRVHVLLELIFSTERSESWQSEAGFMDIIWAEQRRLEAIKLYYKVLGAMCRSEGQRLHTNNLTALLSNERFHRCMITCSAELVLATHKTVTMGFPAVLEPAGITAFDLSKVIEYFVRHEDTLPRELKRHLNTIEERILESMAWEKGSSMYNSLIVARPSLVTEINRLCLLAEPMPALENLGSQERPSPHAILGIPISEGQAVKVTCTLPTPLSVSSPPRNGGSSTAEAGFQSPVKDRLSAFSAFSSPMRNRHRAPLQSAFASPQRPSPLGGGETCADTVINVFFQKVLMLAAVRIRTVCERVGQSQQLIERVYKVFQHALHNETNLFFNRHIDQLVLCTIYGVCKVSKVDVKFRDIIHHYRSQPQSKLNVVRNVFIDQPPLCPTGKTGGLESGDIIKFYNDVFVHATKRFLVQLGSNFTSSPRGAPGPEGDDGETPGSPVASIFSTFPDVSPKKVSALHNVFVSPLRSSKVDLLKSPRTRSLYACVGESTKEYQSPSKDLTAINNRLNKRFVVNGDLAGWTLKKHPQ